jgi:hypothetical protein
MALQGGVLLTLLLELGLMLVAVGVGTMWV